MTPQEIKDKLVSANDAYREGRPFLIDAEFDALEEKLRILDPTNEWFDKGVNDATPKKRKVKLPYPMMSLNKHKTIDSLKAWASNFPGASFVVTPKFDGLSVGIQGNTSWTRGDGVIGQDCTKQLMHVKKMDKDSSHFVARGEIIFNHENWEKFKELHPEAASPRNSATGLINGDFDVTRIEEYNLLSVMYYELIDSQASKTQQLNYFGNTPSGHIPNIDMFTDDFLLHLFMKWKEWYPIDGLVIDVNEPEFRHGTEANGNPTYAVAYKSPLFSEMGTGIIKEIERSVNRHGIVTPVIVLEEPIFLSGAWINRISAINMRYVCDWGLYPGEAITIIRSGEVIPKIVGVGDVTIPFREMYTKTKEYEAAYDAARQERRQEIINQNFDKAVLNNIYFCPSCGANLCIDSWDDNWHELVCQNPTCRAKALDKVIKFFTISQIDGFGEKKIEQIYDYITSKPENLSKFCDFFSVLNITRQELLSLEGWAETSVDNFLAEITKIKTTLPLARFLHATGWFGELGEKTLQKILDSDGWDASKKQLLLIEGVQDKTAQTYLEGKKIYDHYDSYKPFTENFTFAYIKTSDVVKEGKLSGLNVCMTGFRDKMLASQITELGGNVLDSVTKNVNCVITKDKNSSSSKIAKAKKMGIEVLEIEEFKIKYF